MINITVMRKVSYVKKFWFYPIISAFLSFSYLVYMDGLVSVKDLVQEKTGQTSWQRPKQWKRINNLTYETDDYVYAGFGDKKLRDNKSESLVYLSQSREPVAPANASAQIYNRLRRSLMTEQHIRKTLEQSLKNSTTIECTTDPSSTQVIDHKEYGNTVGIIYLTISCEVGRAKFVTKARLTVGKNDGLARFIAISTDGDVWEKNAQAFEAMLNNISEVGDERYV